MRKQTYTRLSIESEKEREFLASTRFHLAISSHFLLPCWGFATVFTLRSAVEKGI